MRTLLLLLITLMLWVGADQALAQSANEPLNPGKMKDGYAMHQSRMIQIQDGQVSPLTRDVSLQNGLKVSRDGMVTAPGKSRQKLSEGYAVNKDGKIVLLNYDMMRYDAIQEHSQKTVGNTDSEVIITDNGLTLAGTGEKKSATEALISRRTALIGERNILIKQKADLLNKAKDRKAQQNSPEIREVDARLQQLTRELKEVEQQMRQP
jgi:hypothetical protein